MPLEISRRDARVTALSGLIDYAGLFPPASLDMVEAVAGYRQARVGSASWMVDRFICPATRLEELLGVLTSTMEEGEARWPVTVTASSGWLDSLAGDAGMVGTFSDAAGSAASVAAIEIKVPSEVAADEAALTTGAAAVMAGFGAIVFFELPWEPDPALPMGVLQHVREGTGRALGVKIRCGGTEASLFPPPPAVARFLSAAALRDLPLKATAGLHHPFRHIDPKTGFSHHGFVNLLTAAALAFDGAGPDRLADVVADEDSGSFAIHRGGLGWREDTVGEGSLSQMRSGLLVGYGSCSFNEPVADLTRLGVLPVESA